MWECLSGLKKTFSAVLIPVAALRSFWEEYSRLSSKPLIYNGNTDRSDPFADAIIMFHPGEERGKGNSLLPFSF